MSAQSEVQAGLPYFPVMARNLEAVRAAKRLAEQEVNVALIRASLEKELAELESLRLAYREAVSRDENWQ